MAMNLQFINLTNQKDVSVEDTRKLVRSHAMRHFRHRQRQNMQFDTSLPEAKPARFRKSLSYKQSRTGSLGPSSRVENLNKDMDEDEDESDVIQGRSSTFAELFRATAKPPQFELFPISLPQKYIYKVFDHYSAAVAGGFLPLGKFVPSNPMRTKILPLVASDAALFHTILANSGMDMMVWRQEQFFDPVHNSSANGTLRGTIFCTRHKLEGIRAINAKLNDPVLSLADETILAVCHLAGLEMLASTTKINSLPENILLNFGSARFDATRKLQVLTSQRKSGHFGLCVIETMRITSRKPQERYKEVKIHLDGLEQMLKLRGGLRVIGWNTCIAQMVLRIDHLYSALTGAKPRFTANDLFDMDPELSAEYSDVPHGLPTGSINPELDTIIFQLRDASEFLEVLENPISEGDFFSFGLKRISIEDSLFRLGTSHITYPSASLTQIDQCCQFACVLYVQTVLTKVNCKVYRSLVTALRRNLEQIDIKKLNEDAPSLLLWMILIGGGAAPYNEDRSWFLENLVTCLRSNLWSEVIERLQGWPWRPKYCSSWRMIWRHAVIKRDTCSAANLLPHFEAGTAEHS